VYGIGNQAAPLVAEGLLAAVASDEAAPSPSSIDLAYPSNWWIDSPDAAASSASLDRPIAASETHFEDVAVASRRTSALTDAALEQASASTRWDSVDLLEMGDVMEDDPVWSADNWTGALDPEHESFPML
jgi:hypothetical protein